MVGAIGFEYTPLQPFQPFAGLGWQPKEPQPKANGTVIGHRLDMQWWRGAVPGHDYTRADLRIMSLNRPLHRKKMKHLALQGIVAEEYAMRAEPTRVSPLRTFSEPCGSTNPGGNYKRRMRCPKSVTPRKLKQIAAMPSGRQGREPNAVSKLQSSMP